MNKKILFGSNLKNLRIKNNMTQKQLAQKIGYTEKSVSKWETDSGIPTIEMLLRLGEIFGVSLDELIFQKTDDSYFLGIDAGGTKTVFKLTDADNNVVTTVCKGSANPNDIGLENAMTVLKEGICEVCAGIPYGSVSMFAGISGGGLTGDNAKLFNKFFSKFGFFVYGNGSDVENLIALANNPKCVVVIMGTGSIVYSLSGNKRKRIGGWGQFFDEGGSGYTIGRDVITAALREHDGSGEKTLLSELLEKEIGEKCVDHLAKFYQGGKRYVASFSSLAFLAVEKGDKIAKEIIEKNMAYVANLIDASYGEFLDEKEIPVFISGGLSAMGDILFPIIEKHLVHKEFKVSKLTGEPVDGAIRCAQKLYDEKRGEMSCKE